MTGQADVAVIGGGLAGLTLALHLKKRIPHVRVTVIERRQGPAPVAAHKVGESTVEIGAHYLASTLGLEDHLAQQHLRKFGFRFFSSDRNEHIDRVQEIGVSRYLSVTSYQIDRGILENFLVDHARAAGVDVCLGASVEDVRLGSSGHELDLSEGGARRTLAARWIVDASGRAGFLKKRLGLAAECDHDVNSVWFRVPARLDPEDWSTDSHWLQRCLPGNRWLSTNHLVGDGYWVWMIPLSSGHHSIGIVAEAQRHPFATMSSYERALTWLGEHQPRLARALREAGNEPIDFAGLRHFSYDCTKLYSADRWAITGEAGVFLDPFYSPGSDFIAISNTYIVDLVQRDLAGEDFPLYAAVYERLYRSFFNNTLSLYRGQYGVFAHPLVLSMKVIWDYTYYWGVLCQLFFQERLTDLRALGDLRDVFGQVQALNAVMQPFLRRCAVDCPRENLSQLLDQAELPWFAALNRSLTDRLDDREFRERIRSSRDRLVQLALEIVDRIVDRVGEAVLAWPETDKVLRSAGASEPCAGDLLAYSTDSAATAETRLL